MKIKKHVFNNYEIYIVKTKKFKTIKIQTMFLNTFFKIISNICAFD